MKLIWILSIIILIVGAVLFLTGFFVPFDFNNGVIPHNNNSIYDLLNHDFHNEDLFTLWNKIKDSLSSTSEGRILFIIAFAGFGLLLLSALSIIVNIFRLIPFVRRRK